MGTFRLPSGGEPLFSSTAENDDLSEVIELPGMADGRIHFPRPQPHHLLPPPISLRGDQEGHGEEGMQTGRHHSCDILDKSEIQVDFIDIHNTSCLQSERVS